MVRACARKRAYIYCRESKKKELSDSLCTQEKRCRAYCRKNKLAIKKRVHKEVRSAWKSKNKNSLQMIICNLNPGDLLIVSRVNRLSRDYKTGLRFAQELKKKNIDIVSVEENITFFNNTKVFKCLLRDAQEESDVKSKKQHAIARYHRRIGFSMGAIAPFGYEFYYIEKNIRKQKRNEKEQGIITYIEDLLKCDLSYQSIVTTLNYYGLFKRGNQWNIQSLGNVIRCNRKRTTRLYQKSF